jgi:hypothetical protein
MQVGAGCERAAGRADPLPHPGIGRVQRRTVRRRRAGGKGRTKAGHQLPDVEFILDILVHAGSWRGAIGCRRLCIFHEASSIPHAPDVVGSACLQASATELVPRERDCPDDEAPRMFNSSA